MDPRDGQILEAVYQAKGGRKEGIERAKFTTQELDETCRNAANTNRKSSSGKLGRFVACAGYPECSYTRNVNETRRRSRRAHRQSGKQKQAELDGRGSPKCGGRLSVPNTAVLRCRIHRLRQLSEM